MRATLADLARVLVHAPAVAVVDLTDTAAAMHAASACVAGGYRAVAIAASVRGADALVGALAARHDTVVGAFGVPDEAMADDFVAEGAVFVGTASTPSGAPAPYGPKLETRGALWVPQVRDAGEAVAAADAGARAAWVVDAASLGPDGFAALRRAAPRSLALWAHGGLRGDGFVAFLEAGAEAVGLSDALMTPSLAADGRLREVRGYAATTHRDATHAALGLDRPPPPWSPSR